MVNEIQATNFGNQVDQIKANNQAIQAKQAEEMTNVATVQSTLQDLKSIAA